MIAQKTSAEGLATDGAHQDTKRLDSTRPRAAIKEADLMRLIAMAALDRIKWFIERATRDDTWQDEWINETNACELAQQELERLINHPALTLDEFNLAWWRVTGVVGIARKTFTSRDTAPFRFLDDIEAEMTAYGELLEYCEEAGRANQ